MTRQLWLGSLVGLVVGLLCWRGNQSPHLVSTFPDAVTFAVLAGLLLLTIRIVLRRGDLRGRSASLHAGLTVAAAAGLVFGAIVVSLGLARFAAPTPLLLAFGFFTAFGAAVACGVFAALLPAAAPPAAGR
jgi:hypothetical protein